jgi:ketosteroid isomerase-like protein
MPAFNPNTPLFAGSAEEVEAQFYEALQKADLDQLMQCWAEDEDVVCVHPGGKRLVGFEDVRKVFESVFANGALLITTERLHSIHSLTGAVHSVLERIHVTGENGQIHEILVIATNIYMQTPQGWRMVTHHASAADPEEDQLSPPASVTLH